MAPRIRRLGFAVAFAAVALVGCSPAEPSASEPTTDQVRTEAESALAQVVAALPEGVTVEQLPESVADCPTGAAVTVHAVVLPDAGLDRTAAVAALPGALGDGWEVSASALETAFPSMSLVAAAHGGALVEIIDTTAQPDDPSIDITAVSRCGVLVEG